MHRILEEVVVELSAVPDGVQLGLPVDQDDVVPPGDLAVDVLEGDGASDRVAVEVPRRDEVPVRPLLVAGFGRAGVPGDSGPRRSPAVGRPARDRRPSRRRGRPPRADAPPGNRAGTPRGSPAGSPPAGPNDWARIRRRCRAGSGRRPWRRRAPHRSRSRRAGGGNRPAAGHIRRACTRGGPPGRDRRRAAAAAPAGTSPTPAGSARRAARRPRPAPAAAARRPASGRRRSAAGRAPPFSREPNSLWPQ